MKLFIYCSGSESQIDEQEKATTAFAAANGVIVPRIFREHDVAAGTYHWKRTKLNAAYSFTAEGLPNRAAEGILVETLDALGSSKPIIALALYAAEWAGIAIYSVNRADRSLNRVTLDKEGLSESEQQIVESFDAAIAWDRHLRSETLTLARKQSARKKEFNAIDGAEDMTENLGYARRGNLAQRTFERGVVGWIFYNRFENKSTFPEIAQKLAEAKIPIPNPNFSASRPWQPYRGPYAWSVDTIRNVVSSWKARTDLLREHYKPELPTNVTA